MASKTTKRNVQRRSVFKKRIILDRKPRSSRNEKQVTNSCRPPRHRLRRISTTLTDCLRAETSFMVKRYPWGKAVRTVQWPHADCKKTKRECREALRSCIQTRNKCDRTTFVQVRKSYKQLLKTKGQNFNREKVAQLAFGKSRTRNLSKRLGDETWVKPNTTNLDIEMTTLDEHFKKFFSDDEDDQQLQHADNSDISEVPGRI